MTIIFDTSRTYINHFSILYMMFFIKNTMHDVKKKKGKNNFQQTCDYMYVHTYLINEYHRKRYSFRYMFLFYFSFVICHTLPGFLEHIQNIYNSHIFFSFLSISQITSW